MLNQQKEIVLFGRNPVVLETYPGSALSDLNQEIQELRKPLIRPYDRRLPVIGDSSIVYSALESGERSALFYLPRLKRWVKAKGLRERLDSSQIFGDGVDVRDPWGTQLLLRARHELEMVDMVSDYFRGKNIRYPLEPAGIWEYSDMTFDGEVCGASLFFTLGDTRLDELMYKFQLGLPFMCLEQPELDRISNVFSRLFKLAGQTLRTFHDGRFTWNPSIGRASNAHIGNIVLFDDNERVGLAPVDFDGVTKHLIGRANRSSLLSQLAEWGINKLEDINTAVKNQMARYLHISNGELDHIRMSIAESKLLMTGEVVAFNPESAHFKLIENILKSSGRELSPSRMSAVVGNVIENGNLGQYDWSIKAIGLKAFNEAYKAHRSNSPLEEISWDELTSLIDAREDMIANFSDKVRRAITVLG